MHFRPNTERYQDHIVSSSGYKLVYVDQRFSAPYKTYFDEDSIDKFSNNMIKRSGYYPEVIKTQFNKPLVMTEKGLEDFNNSAKG